MLHIKPKHISCSVTFFSKFLLFMRQSRKMLYSRAGHRWQYGTWWLHAGYLSLQTCIQYVILTAFSLQLWLKGIASILRYTYIFYLLVVYWWNISKTPSKSMAKSNNLWHVDWLGWRFVSSSSYPQGGGSHLVGCPLFLNQSFWNRGRITDKRPLGDPLSFVKKKYFHSLRVIKETTVLNITKHW